MMKLGPTGQKSSYSLPGVTTREDNLTQQLWFKRGNRTIAIPYEQLARMSGSRLTSIVRATLFAEPIAPLPRVRSRSAGLVRIRLAESARALRQKAFGW